MELEIKQTALNELYRLFEETLAPFSRACHKGCDHCCSTQVTATTLEIWPVWQQWATLKTGKKSALSPVDPDTRPRITINDLAARCAKDEPIPDQTEPVATESRCLFLANHCCQLYPVRPFACRMMVSAHNCGEFGYAEVKPLILTIANIIMQAIEHLDHGGLTGHMGDILNHFEDANIREIYASGKKLGATATLLANQPLTTLMVPPEHRLQAMPVVQKINTILAKVFFEK
jgi:Fe-S-cluster containining protein